MHHPEQFDLMAKSVQDDRLQAAVASRAGKKARSRQIDRHPRFSWLARLGEFRQIVGLAAANFRQLSAGFTRAAYKDS